jgi:hypothetical protein
VCRLAKHDDVEAPVLGSAGVVADLREDVGTARTCALADEALAAGMEDRRDGAHWLTSAGNVTRVAPGPIRVAVIPAVPYDTLGVTPI